MRYIDHTNCKKAFEKGEDHEIQSLGNEMTSCFGIL